MKVRISRTAVLEALQILHRVVTTRTTVPILSNVLIEADDGMVSMRTTDLELSVRCTLEAEVLKSGASTLPARRLVQIIRELPADDVEIEVDDKQAATIKCGASFFKILGIAAEDFPVLPDFESGFSHTIEQSTLRDMLRNTAYSASSDETRHVLNGVLMSFAEDKLTVVATDGRRLALMEHELEFPKEAETDVIVPSKTVGELMQALGDEGEVKLHSSEKQVAFEFNSILVVSKLIEGTYPNFRQVIPASSEERVAIEREQLLTAVRRVSLVTSDKSSSVKLQFTTNSLKISAVTPDVGEAHETVALKYSGKDISVAFNPDFLMNPLRQLSCDEVYMEVTDELSPGLLKCDVPFLYVLMPMRIS